MDVALIGRSAQRAQLAALLAGAQAGRGGTAMLLGDAGIGKTSLARAVVHDATEAGFEVVFGRAWEFADAPPYFPLRPSLHLLGLEVPEPTAGGTALEMTFRFWERVVEALARRAAAQPVLWVLDDLHAADQQTLELCCFLSEPIRALRALVVGTSRLNDLRHDPSSNLRLARLRRHATEIVLEPLPGTEVAALAEQHIGRRLDGGGRRRLIELTGGNPLFVVECARALRQAGAARLDTLPASLRLLAIEQVEQLSATTRSLVESGAVVGREFALPIVARMHGLLTARALDDLAPALRAGLLHELRPAEFCFSHALIRDAVYEALSAERRIALHQRVEQALLELDEPGTFVARAHHALCGIEHGAAAMALALADEVSRQLEAQAAFDRALALTTRALEARRAAGLGVPIGELLRAAELAFLAGAFADSRRWCDDALARARDLALPVEFARAALILGAGLRPANVDDTLVRALQEALTTLPAGERGLRLRLRARLAAAVQPAPDPLGPVEEARGVIAESDALGDDRVRVEVLVFCGSAMVDYAPIQERMAHARALRDVALRLGDRPRALVGYHRLVYDELQSGDVDAFELHADELLALARELGHPKYLWRALLVHSMRAVARGRFEESAMLMVEIEHLAALTDEPALADSLRAHRLMRLRTMHRDAEALLVAEPYTQQNVFPEILAALLTGHHALFENRAEMERLMPAVRPVLHHIRYEPVNWSGVLEAVAAVGSDAERRSFLALLQPHADEQALSTHIALTYEGPVARVIGLLQASLGERAAAIASLRRALAWVARHDFRPWVARISYELGQLLDGEAAAPYLAEAARLADELDLVWLRARLRSSERAAAARSVAPPSALILRRDGELWVLETEGRAVYLHDSRGMQLLARLLDQPGEELHVLGLASDDANALADTDAGEVLDSQAVRAYRERLCVLDRQLAASRGDDPRLAVVRKERATLERELAAARGLAGRARRVGSASERARINVQRRLRDAIRRISEVDAALGRYLDRAIRTGTYCSFRP